MTAYRDWSCDLNADIKPSYVPGGEEEAVYYDTITGNADVSKSEEAEKNLDDYLTELGIYVDLNNLSPEAIQRILIASEKKFKEADELFDESNELLEESHKNLDDSLKQLEKAEEYYKSKPKSKSNEYGFGKLVHNIYSDGKSLFGYGVMVVLAWAVFSGPLDDYKEEDKVLKYAVEEEAFFDKGQQTDYLENDVEISFNKLETFYDDISIILEKGYDSKADKDYLKSIYIKSIILNESLDSLKVDNSDFQTDLNKLINELEVDLDIEIDK